MDKDNEQRYHIIKDIINTELVKLIDEGFQPDKSSRDNLLKRVKENIYNKIPDIKDLKIKCDEENNPPSTVDYSGIAIEATWPTLTEEYCNMRMMLYYDNGEPRIIDYSFRSGYGLL